MGMKNEEKSRPDKTHKLCERGRLHSREPETTEVSKLES